MGQVTLDLGALFGSGGKPTGDPNRPFGYNFWDKMSGREDPNRSYQIRKMLDDQNFSQQKELEGIRNADELARVRAQQAGELDNRLKVLHDVPGADVVKGQAEAEAERQRIINEKAAAQTYKQLKDSNPDFANAYLNNEKFTQAMERTTGLPRTAPNFHETIQALQQNPAGLQAMSDAWKASFGQGSSEAGLEGTRKVEEASSARKILGDAKANFEAIPHTSAVELSKHNTSKGFTTEQADDNNLGQLRATNEGATLVQGTAIANAETPFAGQAAQNRNTILQHAADISNYPPLLGGNLNLSSGQLWRNEQNKRLVDPSKPFDPIKNPMMNDPFGGTTIQSTPFAQPRPVQGPVQGNPPQQQPTPVGKKVVNCPKTTTPPAEGTSGVIAPSASPEAASEAQPYNPLQPAWGGSTGIPFPTQQVRPQPFPITKSSGSGSSNILQKLLAPRPSQGYIQSGSGYTMGDVVNSGWLQKLLTPSWSPDAYNSQYAPGVPAANRLAAPAVTSHPIGSSAFNSTQPLQDNPVNPYSRPGFNSSDDDTKARIIDLYRRLIGQ